MHLKAAALRGGVGVDCHCPSRRCTPAEIPALSCCIMFHVDFSLTGFSIESGLRAWGRGRAGAGQGLTGGCRRRQAARPPGQTTTSAQLSFLGAGSERAAYEWYERGELVVARHTTPRRGAQLCPAPVFPAGLDAGTP